MKLESVSFPQWLKACEDIAMESEWCIDESWPRWRELFMTGATPEDAVNELFDGINNEQFWRDVRP